MNVDTVIEGLPKACSSSIDQLNNQHLDDTVTQPGASEIGAQTVTPVITDPGAGMQHRPRVRYMQAAHERQKHFCLHAAVKVDTL